MNQLSKIFTLHTSFVKSAYLVSLCLVSVLGINHSSSAYLKSLGNIKYSEPFNPNQESGVSIDPVIDGSRRATLGFSLKPNIDQATYLQLRIAELPLQYLNLQAGESVAYYSLRTSIFYGHVDYTARTFTLSYSTDDAVSFTTITDYTSAENERGSSSISYDTNGVVTASTQPTAGPNPFLGYLETHVVTFKIPANVVQSITHLRYNLPANAGWITGVDANIAISEFETHLSAEIVPEPSTYALLLGFISFAFIAFKKRKMTEA